TNLPRPSFEFRFGAAGIPKPVSDSSSMDKNGRNSSESDDEPLVMSQQEGLCVRVGEDAYFCRRDGLGVADGVGGWAHVVKGSNAALFSSRLMHHCASQLEHFDDILNDYDINDYYGLDPVKVMQVACERTLEDAGQGPNRAVGSTTALVAFLRDDELRLASLGDTSLIVLRNGNMIFRTEEQQHSFNFPYQLGSDSKDTPEKDAGSWAVKVREGDVVLIGSDGIFDNLFDEDILDIVNSVVMGTPAHPPTHTHIHEANHHDSNHHAHNPTPVAVLPKSRILRTDPHAIASAILVRARDVALDSGTTVVSPFQERAVKEGLYYQGGKMDDLTVVVGIVSVMEDSPDRR
ncbi:hypothetical protein HDU78_011243, partial [Chytriomyces hyalinus]